MARKSSRPCVTYAGYFKLGFIEDPWGTKIEVVQDTEQLGFHHVHLSVPDPPNVLSWYQEAFGGERAKLKGRIDALRYGGVWLLAAASAAGEKPAGSAGRAIYNLAWTVPSLDDAVAALKAKGLKVTVESRSLPTVRTRLSGSERDPDRIHSDLEAIGDASLPVAKTGLSVDSVPTRSWPLPPYRVSADRTNEPKVVVPFVARVLIKGSCLSASEGFAPSRASPRPSDRRS